MTWPYFRELDALEDFSRALCKDHFVRAVQAQLCAHLWRPKKWWLVPTRYELKEWSQPTEMPPGWDRVRV